MAVAVVPSPSAEAQDSRGTPHAGVSTTLPEGYDYTRQDVLDGDTYHYASNGLAQANIMTRTGSNNQPGTFEPGWLADFTLLDDVRRETIDWSELMLSPTLPAAGAWGQADVALPLPDVTVDGDAIVASGAAVADPDVEATLTYRMLPDAPVLKLELELTNTGADAFEGYVQYLLDPDSRSDRAIVPGIGGTNPGLVESGWTGNWVYDGPTTDIDEPAHGLAWATDEPAAVTAAGYIFGVWFDATLEPGAARTVSWYHITDYPSAGDPTAAIARWAADIDLLDPDVPAQPRVTGRIADTDTALGVPGVEVVARNIDSETVGTAITDEEGNYRVALPPGTYTLTATRLGYQTSSRSIEVEDGVQSHQLDFEMAPVVVAAGTGKVIPGPVSEGGRDDIVMENQLLAMTIATVTQDGQLAPTTPGKPIDMAATGRADELDWFNLPWMSTERPSGTENWQSLTVRNDRVEVVESTPDRAVVETSGTWTEDSDVTVTTTYTVEPDRPWVTAETVFTNTGSTDHTVWLGDVVDNDGGGQQSYVPGIGVLPNAYGAPAEFQPTQPWVAQVGSQPQVQGMLYTGANTDFVAFGTSAYVATHFQTTLAAGQDHRLDRRLVVLGTEPGEDRFAAFHRLYEDHLAEQTGLQLEFEVTPTSLESGGQATATATVSNTGDEPLVDVTLELAPPLQLDTGDPLTHQVDVAVGDAQDVTWTLTATDGGRGQIDLAVTHDERTLQRRGSVFVDGPGWFWGDNHSHSRHSDGSGTIAENFASARNHGLSWLTATDHNTIAQRDDVALENREDFVALFGEEITAGDGHSLGYNIDELIGWAQDPQGRIDQTNASNGGEGFFFVAHPYYPGLEWEDWTIQDYAGIEVWNGFYPPRHAVNAQAFAKWDELNREGMHLIGIANSDAHNPGKIGSPHIRAYLPELSDQAIWAAMRTGRFYGSDGPDLRFTMGDATMGGDVTVPAGGDQVAVTIEAFADDPITSLTILQDGEALQTWTPEATTAQQKFTLEVVPGEFYRVELETASRRFAFTNPIWVAEGEPDACPDGHASDVAVVFGSTPVDAGVPNRDTGDGCTILDLVDRTSPWRNHGDFVADVAEVLEQLRDQQLVTDQEASRIRQAAARSDVGR